MGRLISFTATSILFVFIIFQFDSSKFSLAQQFRLCEPLTFDGDITCTPPNFGHSDTCTGPQRPGTIAKYRCKPHFAFYETATGKLQKYGNAEEEMRCGESGRWIGLGRFKSYVCREDCGRRLTNPKPLVVNGVPTNMTSWPWHAAIFRRTSSDTIYICGGAVVSRHFILTAAHCVTSNNGNKYSPNATVVVLGAFNSQFSRNRPGVETQILNVKRVFVSESYDVRKEFQADIALLQLEDQILYNDYISPVCLPNDFAADTNAIKPGQLGDVVGFGVDETGKPSGILKYGRLEIKSHPECFIRLQRILTESQFCAGSHSGNRVTVCNGDSGGGLFRPSIITEKYYVHGIVSTGDLASKDGVCQNDAVFTRVYSFIFWIRDILEGFSGDIVLQFTSKSAFPYIQKGTETRRSQFEPIPDEWKNKVTTIQLSYIDIEPELFLKSLEYSKTVQHINLTQVKLLKDFPSRRIQLPLLKNISMDILKDDWTVGSDRLFPKTFSKDVLRSLIFFEKDIDDSEMTISQILGMKTNIQIMLHIFKAMDINHDLGRITLSQVAFSNEILADIPNSGFNLKYLALSRSPIDISLLRNQNGIQSLILDKVVLPEKEFPDLLKEGMKELVLISATSITIDVSDLPKSLGHLALTRAKLYSVENRRKMPPKRISTSTHSSSFIYPPENSRRFKRDSNAPELVSFYCDLCLSDPAMTSHLSRTFPNLKKLVLRSSHLPRNLHNFVEEFRNLEFAFLLSSGETLKATKFVRNRNGQLVLKPMTLSWQSEFVHLNYIMNRKWNFWSSESEYIALTRLSTPEKESFRTGQYVFNGGRYPLSNGSSPLTQPSPDERFQTIPPKIQPRIISIEVQNAEVLKRNLEDSLKNARKLKQLRLLNVSSTDMVFKGLASLPDLEEFRVECNSNNFFNQFGYKGYSLILESIYNYIFPYQEEGFNFRTNLPLTKLKLIHFQHSKCVEASWNSVEGKLISGTSFTNDWLRNYNKSNPIRSFAFKYGELEHNAVPSTITRLNLNFIVLKSIGRLLEKLNSLVDLRLINVRVEQSEDFKNWEWLHLNLADLSLHSKTLEYLALEKTHVRNYRPGIAFDKVKTIVLENCTFEEDFVVNFMKIFPNVRNLVILGESGEGILLGALNDQRIEWVLSSASTIAGNSGIKSILQRAGVGDNVSKYFILERVRGSWVKQRTSSFIEDFEQESEKLAEMKGMVEFGNDPQCYPNTFVGGSPFQLNKAVLDGILGFIHQKTSK